MFVVNKSIFIKIFKRLINTKTSMKQIKSKKNPGFTRAFASSNRDGIFLFLEIDFFKRIHFFKKIHVDSDNERIFSFPERSRTILIDFAKFDQPGNVKYINYYKSF